MGGVRRAEDARPLCLGVLLARQTLGDSGVFGDLSVGPVAILKGVLHGSSEDLCVLGVGEDREVVSGDDAQNLGKGSPAGGGRAVGVDGAPLVRKRKRFTDHGLVGDEILLSEDPTF